MMCENCAVLLAFNSNLEKVLKIEQIIFWQDKPGRASQPMKCRGKIQLPAEQAYKI